MYHMSYMTRRGAGGGDIVCAVNLRKNRVDKDTSHTAQHSGGIMYGLTTRGSRSNMIEGTYRGEINTAESRPERWGAAQPRPRPITQVEKFGEEGKGTALVSTRPQHEDEIGRVSSRWAREATSCCTSTEA